MKRFFRAGDYRPDPHRDVLDEMQSHLDLKVEDLMAQGLTEEEARREALRTTGGSSLDEAWAVSTARATTHTRRRLRRRSFLHHIDTLLQDVRYALRRMGQNPGFTLIAILSLAVGIGANTAVFSAVNALFLRPPPYHAPEELVQVWSGFRDRAPTSSASWEEYQALREVADVFSGIGAYDGILTRIRNQEGTQSAFVEAVTPDLFTVLGIEPALGRFFLPDEGRTPGGDPLAILGYGFWVRAFEGDPGVLGRTVYLAGQSFTIVGVTPPELSALQSSTLITELFIPMSMAGVVSGETDAAGTPVEHPRSVDVLARLAPGVPREAGEVRVKRIARDVLEAQGEEAREGWELSLWPIRYQAINPSIDASLIQVATFLLAVAVLVLLLACTNLANLFLARGVDRKREIAVRLAMGAGRMRLVRQLCTEALLLSALGGLAGLFLAQWTLDLLLRLQPQVGVTFNLHASTDGRVLLFTLGTVSLAGLLVGLAPAMAATRREISLTLKGEAPERRKGILSLRGSLVAFQMSVSVILLTGAGLFLRSLLVAQDTDPGFSTDRSVSVWVDLEKSGVPPSDWERVTEELQARVRAQAGIRLMGTTDLLPLLSRNTDVFGIPGLDPPEGRDGYMMDVYAVDAGYVSVMGIPLLSGRGIEATDREGTPRVVLVSQEAARRFWPEESPLGKEIISSSTGNGYQVVGVVGNVASNLLRDPPRPTVYFSLAQRPREEVYLVAEGAGTRQETVAALRRAVWEVDPDLLIRHAQSLEERLGVNLYPARMAALFLGTFGLMALLLAAIGLYGVVSLSVSRRTREVGVRMSLGADAGRVVAMILGGSLGSVAVGGFIGLSLAILLARLIRGFLFGVEPADPTTLVSVPLILGAVAALAAYLPARRASRVNPVRALRSE